MKVVVYAIAKNEEKFVATWMKSMLEADGVFVMDTGSDDGTVDALIEDGAVVAREGVSPWRFDVARNRSLELAKSAFPDAEWFVCTDLDETLTPGWRRALEDAIDEAKAKGSDPAFVDYPYVHSFCDDGVTPNMVMMYRKIHRRDAGLWKLPCHEFLDFKGRTGAYANGFRLEHRPDKSKCRSYMQLIELGAAENPDMPHAQFLLAREYYNEGRDEDAIRIFEKFVSEEGWTAECANAMRFLANANLKLGRNDAAELWLWRAIAKNPGDRRAAYELMLLATMQGRHDVVAQAGKACMAVERPSGRYPTHWEEWSYRPHELLAVALWGLGKKDAARMHELAALEAAPEKFKASVRRNAEKMGCEIPD